MSFTMFATAGAWGIGVGYLVCRFFDSFLGMGFCLHGLLNGRWKRLAGKVATGVVRPEILWNLLAKLILHALLFAVLLKFGDDYVSGKLRFEYAGNGSLLFWSGVVVLILSRLPLTRRRLVHYWRVSHEVDYAERRRRTQLLW